MPPECLSGPPYVNVPPRQNCSRPSWQLGQVRQESTMQPTAAMSPTLNFVTFGADARDAPEDLVAGHDGILRVKPHSLRAKCRSVWQTPQ
jgi:hypothetical protein